MLQTSDWYRLRLCVASCLSTSLFPRVLNTWKAQYPEWLPARILSQQKLRNSNADKISRTGCISWQVDSNRGGYLWRQQVAFCISTYWRRSTTTESIAQPTSGFFPSELQNSAGPSTSTRRILQLTALFKIMLGLIDILPSEYLIPANSKKRSSHVHKSQQYSTSSCSFKSSFFPKTIPVWNKLPAITAEAHSFVFFFVFPPYNGEISSRSWTNIKITSVKLYLRAWYPGTSPPLSPTHTPKGRRIGLTLMHEKLLVWKNFFCFSLFLFCTLK